VSGSEKSNVVSPVISLNGSSNGTGPSANGKKPEQSTGVNLEALRNPLAVASLAFLAGVTVTLVVKRFG